MIHNGECWSIVDADAMIAAVDRELQLVADRAAELERKGRQSSAEGAYVRRLLEDVRADMAHAFGPFDRAVGWHRPGQAINWQAKVRWMKGELALRESSYPDLVAKGRMLEADAKAGIRIMRGLVRLYYEGMFQWEPEGGPALEYIRAARACSGDPAKHAELTDTPGQLAYRRQADELYAVIQAEQGKGQGELIAA